MPPDSLTVRLLKPCVACPTADLFRRSRRWSHRLSSSRTQPATSTSRAPAEDLDPDRARAVVLRAFLVDGRLVAFPAARGKRRTVLEHVAASFEPWVRYSEPEVNAILRAWHPDHAALRRYLVDEELLAREAGVYWRIGGPVHH